MRTIQPVQCASCQLHLQLKSASWGTLSVAVWIPRASKGRSSSWRHSWVYEERVPKAGVRAHVKCSGGGCSTAPFFTAPCEPCIGIRRLSPTVTWHAFSSTKCRARTRRACSYRYRAERDQSFLRYNDTNYGLIPARSPQRESLCELLVGPVFGSCWLLLRPRSCAKLRFDGFRCSPGRSTVDSAS